MRSSAPADVSWLHKDRLEAGRVQQSKRCIDAGREWMDVLGTVYMFITISFVLIRALGTKHGVCFSYLNMELQLC